MAGYRGRWVLVNVWASWCPPCQSESPDLERYYDANRGKDFTIVGVDTNDLSTDGLKFVKSHDITYPQLHDGNGDFAENDLKTTGVPESFLVNPQGKLVLHSLGPVTERYLDANVTPFITGKAKQRGPGGAAHSSRSRSPRRSSFPPTRSPPARCPAPRRRRRRTSPTSRTR